MGGIVPIPTTRVGDLFVRQRLVSQTQVDQLELFRLQNQISTGHRIQLPSEDAPAALRAINLQRLLDRKGQIQTNLQASNSYLAAADAGLATVSDLLNTMRGEVIAVTSTLSTDSERQTLIQRIDQAIETLVATGNSKSQGRYLFAGSRAQVQPYDLNGEFIEYFGNEGVLRSYVDLERLFDTNLSGTDVFGGISSGVQGEVDLDPHVTGGTLVRSINGGNGISRNPAVTISISNGLSTTSSVVDLSGAVTLGDVARLIEEGAPAGSIVVDVTGTGFKLAATGGTITIGEVAEGRTARELGILTPAGAAPSTMLTGSPLNAAVLKTTRLETLLGAKAQGRIASAGANNDIVITAATNGTALNDVRVVFVDDAIAGAETAVYDDSVPANKTLTVHIQAGTSTASQVAAAIAAEGHFTAELDYRDALSANQIGTGTVADLDFGQITSGGSGQALDTTSGLILNNGGRSATLDTSGAETVEDFMNLVNGAGLGLLAEINANRDGINIRSRLSGADLTIGENGGLTATQLGIRTFTEDTTLADFNRGVGVPTDDTLGKLDQTKLDSVSIIARDGTTLNVNLAGASTLQEVANRINLAPGNNAGTTAVLARLTADGNGLELADSSGTPPFANALTVQAPVGTTAATYLRLVPAGQTQVTSSSSVSGLDYVLTGNDVVKNDLAITSRSGTRFWVDLTDATTVQDVLDRMNDAASDAGISLTARVADTGNGIELVDASAGAGTLSVEAAEGSQAGEFLGFLPNGAVTTDGAGSQILTSQDRHTYETESVFNTLLRLKTALEQNDVQEIGRTIDRLDADLNRVNFARAEIGARLQNLEVIDTRLKDENVQLKASLSQDIDVDLIEAISNLTARQFAFEASLRTSATLLQLSLLNFI